MFNGRRHSCSIPLARLVALLAVPIAAQAQPASLAASRIRAARLAQNLALASHQMDSAATFWDPDVVITAGRGTVLRGRQSYRDAFASDSGVVYQRRPDKIETAAAWPLAWEAGTWTGRRGMRGPVLIHGRYAAQWRRVGDRWLIRSEVFVALGCAGEACAWPVASP